MPVECRATKTAAGRFQFRAGDRLSLEDEDYAELLEAKAVQPLTEEDDETAEAEEVVEVEAHPGNRDEKKKTRRGKKKTKKKV